MKNFNLPNSTFNFDSPNKPVFIISQNSEPVKFEDNLEEFHVSKVKSQNPEFSLSVDEISLIREFPNLMKDFEEIDKNWKNILKQIGE